MNEKQREIELKCLELEAQVIIIEVKGMEAENKEREMLDVALAFPAEIFNAAAKDMNKIIDKMRNLKP